jgi:TPR repeat protein
VELHNLGFATPGQHPPLFRSDSSIGHFLQGRSNSKRFSVVFQSSRLETKDAAMEIDQVFLDKALGLGLPLSMIHDALLSTMTGSTCNYQAAASELIKCSGSASSMVSTRPAAEIAEDLHAFTQRAIAADQRLQATMEVRLLGLRLAAEQGEAGSQFDLGWKYAHGEGVKVDKAKAAQLFGQAAEQGHDEAQHELGLCYAHGEGVEMDVAKAARLSGQAAEQGHAEAQYELGTCYALGTGVEKDEAKAARLYGQAAEQGRGAARLWLGWLYEHGQGTGQDASVAVEQYRLAAAMDDRCETCETAIASLGLCFEKRRGVPRSNPAEAARLYALAAKATCSGCEEFEEAMAVLPDDSLAPDVPSAAARARTRRAVYLLNLAARLGHVAAAQQFEALAGRRDAVSACCVGCGAERKLKTCSKCRVARFATCSAPRACGRCTRQAARPGVPHQNQREAGPRAEGEAHARGHR